MWSFYCPIVAWSKVILVLIWFICLFVLSIMVGSHLFCFGQSVVGFIYSFWGENCLCSKFVWLHFYVGKIKTCFVKIILGGVVFVINCNGQYFYLINLLGVQKLFCSKICLVKHFCSLFFGCDKLFVVIYLCATVVKTYISSDMIHVNLLVKILIRSKIVGSHMFKFSFWKIYVELIYSFWGWNYFLFQISLVIFLW